MMDLVITRNLIGSWEEECACGFCGAPIEVGDHVFCVDERDDPLKEGVVGVACSRWCANKIVRSEIANPAMQDEDELDIIATDAWRTMVINYNEKHGGDA